MHAQSKSSGHFKLEGVNPDGVCRKIAEFDNLITDIGLLQMGVSENYLNVCRIGSGSTTPQFTDTSLVSQIAYNGDPTRAGGVQSTAPYYAWARRVWTFDVGVAAGNISEIGVGWANTGTTLFSRALIRDAIGNPTTITILPDEVLRVTYEHRYYPALDDATGTLTLTGNIGGSYAYVGRASNITDGTSEQGWSASRSQTSVGNNFGWSQFLSGGIGSVTEKPTGTSFGMSNTPAGVASGVSAVFTVTAGVDQAVFPEGVKSAWVTMGNGKYQFEFTPAIMKTADDILELRFSHTWGRR